MCIQSWHLELWVTPGGLFRLSLSPVFFVKLGGALWFPFSSGVSGGYHFLFKPLPCFLQWPQAWHYFSSLLKSALSGILQSSWSLRPASPLGQKGCAPAPGLKGRQLPISPLYKWAWRRTVSFRSSWLAPPWEEPRHCEPRWGFRENLAPAFFFCYTQNRAFITQTYSLMRNTICLFLTGWNHSHRLSTGERELCLLGLTLLE